MEKKIFLHLKNNVNLQLFLMIAAIIAIFYYPVWLQGKVPLNGNFLVSFYVPWRNEKFEGYPAGVPAKQGGGYDTLRIGYPYFGLVHQSWRDGYLPLWNSYNFAGLPLAAESQSAAFYPLQFLSLFLSQIDLWTVFTISGYLFCFIFTYLYLKYLIGNFLASVFGAFTFAFNTFFIAWSQEVVTAIHAAMWMPLMMLAVDKIFAAKKTFFWWVVLLLSAAFSILSGYVQVTMYVFIITGFYLIWRFFSSFKDNPHNSVSTLLLSLTAMMASVILTLFQTLPLYEMYTLSSRPLIDMKDFLISYLIPLYALIQLIIPSFFGNSGTWNHYGFPAGTFYEHTFSVSLIAVVMALFALLVRIRGEKDKYFFFALGFFSLIFTLDLPISRWVFYLNIPVFSSSIANRLLFIPPFSLAVLSAFGVKIWQEEKFSQIKKSLALTLMLVTGLFISILIWLVKVKTVAAVPSGFPSDWAIIALRNSLIPGVILFLSIGFFILAAVFKKAKKLVIVIFFLLTLFQIGYFFRKITAFSPRQFIYPSHPIFEFIKQKVSPYRFLGVKGAFIENNIATQMRVFSPEGYDSLANRRYAQLLKASETAGKWTDQFSRSDVGISKHIGKNFSANKVRNKLLTLTSTKFILYRPAEAETNKESETKIFGDDFELVKVIEGTKIYRYKKSLPRVLLLADVSIISSNQEIFNRLFDEKFDQQKELILEKETNFITAPDSQSKAKFEVYQSNRVAIKTESKANQWLLLTDAFYPGWHAFVDGQETEIFRANFAFRAVPVPAGNHTVEFRYWPGSFVWGTRISVVTGVVIVMVIFLTKIFRHSTFRNWGLIRN